MASESILKAQRDRVAQSIMKGFRYAESNSSEEEGEAFLEAVLSTIDRHQAMSLEMVRMIGQDACAVHLMYQLALYGFAQFRIDLEKVKAAKSN